MAEDQRYILMGQVAQLYYEQGATQETIAARLRLSRPTISRLLKEARETGIVEITVRRPLGFDPRLEAELLAAFPCLREARVVAGVAGLAEPIMLRNLGQAAAAYLRAVVKDGDIIGVTWGHTMEEVSAALEPRPLTGVTVIQLNGGVSRAASGTNAGEVAQRFGRAFHAEAHLLPVPAIVESEQVAEALAQDRHIAPLLDLARRANVAVFSIGAWGYDSVLYAAGYFTPAAFNQLRARGAAGDICSRYFAADGRVVDPALERRTIGVGLAEIGRKERAVAVAGGLRKVEAILGALRGGFANVLITDEETARAVLDRVRGEPP